MSDSSQPTVLVTFRDYLDTTALSPVSRKAMMSALRRCVRDLSSVDMTDPEALAEYRTQLKPGTRNLFDAMWNHLTLMFASHGIELAKSARRSPVRFVHPLYPSVTLLAVVADYDRLPSVTWGDFASSPHSTDARILAAAHRVWDFQTGGAPAPIARDPLVPNPDCSPMRVWRIRSIVNSRQHSSPKEHIAVLGELVEVLCWAGIGAEGLRMLTDPIMADREAFLRSKGALTVLEAALVPAKRGDVGATLHLLAHRLHGSR
jgi:hypothetical protein